VDGLADTVVVADRSGTISYWNTSAEPLRLERGRSRGRPARPDHPEEPVAVAGRASLDDAPEALAMSGPEPLPRVLVKGVVLNGRIVCPGHQWPFDLAAGWEAVKQPCQSTYDVRIDGTAVLVDVESRRPVIGDGQEATTPGR